MILSEKFINDFRTSLSASIDASQTNLPVNAVAPVSGQFPTRIDDEILNVIDSGTTLVWQVTRGAEGTTATSHTNASKVTNVLTKRQVDFLGNHQGALVYGPTLVVPNNVDFVLGWDFEFGDSEDYFTPTGGSGTTFAISRPGVYQFFSQISWESNPHGYRELQLFKTGGTFSDGIVGKSTLPAVSGADMTQQLVTTITSFPDENYVIRAFQNSGGNLKSKIEFWSPEFTVTRFGDLDPNG